MKLIQLTKLCEQAEAWLTVNVDALAFAENIFEADQWQGVRLTFVNGRTLDVAETLDDIEWRAEQ